MKKCIITLLLATLLIACDNDDNPKPVRDTHRTVLVYIAANNNLGTRDFDDLDIAEMEKAAAAGDLKNGRLLIYHGEPGGTVKLREVTPKGTVTLKEYDEDLSTVSRASMARAFNDMRAFAPASDYGLVLWSHASGWLDNGKSPEITAATTTLKRSWGIDNGKEMSIPDLALSLDGEGFSFIYFDCCFMGNIESLYELRNSARYIVASPAETPLEGMPYDKNMSCFFSDTPDLVQAAKNTFDTYDSLTGRSRSCTMAVYDMARINDVAAATRQVMTVNTTVNPNVTQQQYGTSSYSNRFFDLHRYVNSLTDDSTLLTTFNDALDNFIIYEAHTEQMALSSPAIYMDNARGVSCYIVTENNGSVLIPARYNELEWWADVAAPAFGF